MILIITTHRTVSLFRRFEGTWFIHLQGDWAWFLCMLRQVPQKRWNKHIILRGVVNGTLMLEQHRSWRPENLCRAKDAGKMA